MNWKKFASRIKESHWTKLYIGVACFQVLVVIILQSFIAAENTAESSPLMDADLTSLYNATAQGIAEDRFNRIKWENIAFIGFQSWFLGMAFDATVNQNSAEIVALAVLNLICAMFGAAEIFDGSKWLNIITNYGIDVTPLAVAKKAEVALTVVILMFAIAFVWLSWKMYRQFGWNIYKTLGADISLRSMYRWVQFFVLTLKINIFTHFIVSLFYLIQFVIRSKSDAGGWETIVQIIVTILIPPALWYARDVVSRESRSAMRLFLVFQFIIIIHLLLIFQQTLQPSNNWYFWICLVWLGIIMAIVTIVEGVLVLRNFNKGLKPFVQRGWRKQVQLDLEMSKKAEAGEQEWTIDG